MIHFILPLRLRLLGLCMIAFISVIQAKVPIDSSLVDTSGYVIPASTSYATGSERSFHSLDVPEKEETADQAGIIYRQQLKDIALHRTEDIENLKAYLLGVQKEITEKQKLVHLLDLKSTLELPVGIHKEIGGVDYTILVDSVQLSPSGGNLTAALILELPQSTPGNTKRLFFRASKIAFNSEGGLTGDVKLTLLEDLPIRLGGENGSSVLNLKASQGRTYIEWDCSGFKSLSVQGEVIFSRSFLIPEMPDGSRGTERVKGSFEVSGSHWNDLLVDIDLPPFQMAKLNGVGFSIRKAVFDFSDIRNPLNFRLPRDYPQDFLPAPNSPLWQGIFIREVSVRLGKEFKKKNKEVRTSFAAYELILDEQGLTGRLEAENLIAREEGAVQKWAFSLEDLRIRMQANQLKEAYFAGGIKPSVTDDFLNYEALINPDDQSYQFRVSYEEKINIPLWVAEMEIYPTSYLDVIVEKGEFQAQAHLDGKMRMTNEVVSIPDLNFEQLVISTKAPYLGIGTFSWGDSEQPSKVAQYPISITNMNLQKKENGDIGLQFQVNLNLVGDKGKDGAMSFGGEALITVSGRLDEENGLQKFVYKHTEVGRIGIDVDGGGFKLRGAIDFFREDSIYGRGFQGNLMAEFTPGIKVEAMGLFGNKDGNRYWYADALYQQKTGILIFPGFALYGFGGGVYYHMRQAGYDPSASSGRGVTRSGVKYAPDPSTGLGLKATVVVGTAGSPDAFNGEATFEIAFNTQGGLKYVGFLGKASFMTPPMELGGEKMKEMAKKLAEQGADQLANNLQKAASSSGSVSASLKIDYDVPNRTLHGNLEMFVQAAGGMLKGIGPNNSAGKAVLHFAPDSWYVHIGTPSSRIGLELLGIARTGSYFMIGDKIPEMPAPPSRVISILGLKEYEGNKRDEAALHSGYGFAFGSSLEVDTGDLNFLIFYGRFAAGAGFDLMLKKYGEDARCKGSTSPIGIDGWYAQGQAYAYVDGEIGVQVKLPFKKGKFKILEIGAAALLQAQLPNPTFLRGVVGGYFSILGGLVKGDCKFELTIGNKCEIVGGSVLSGIQVIADATPANTTKEVDVFTSPQVVFNMPVEKIFEMVDVDDIKKSFRIKLDHFKILHQGKPLKGTLEWNPEKDVVAFKAFDIFPARQTLTLQVQVSFEEKKGGTWTPVKSDGSAITETLKSTFQSGIAPTYIPDNNIAYCYPMRNQVNFYKGEYGQGYIQLYKGQPDLFKNDPKYTKKARFIPPAGQELATSIQYNESERTVQFGIPAELAQDRGYHLWLGNIPVQKDGAVDANVTRKDETLDDPALSEVTRTKKTAAGTIEALRENRIFDLHFRSSKYARLDEKIQALNISSGWSWPIQTGIHELGATIQGDELFDQYEIHGDGEDVAPLVEMQAGLGNPWYRNRVYPLVYEGYPVLNTSLSAKRQADPWGIPPAKDLYIRQTKQISREDGTYENIDLSRILLSPETLEPTKPINGIGALIYNLPWRMSRDYMELSAQAASLPGKAAHPWVRLIRSTPFPSILSGSYEVTIRYKLPGINTLTSEKKITIRNP